MNKLIVIILPIAVFINGCTSASEVVIRDQKIEALQRKIVQLTKTNEATKKRLSELQIKYDASVVDREEWFLEYAQCKRVIDTLYSRRDNCY